MTDMPKRIWGWEDYVDSDPLCFSTDEATARKYCTYGKEVAEYIRADSIDMDALLLELSNWADRQPSIYNIDATDEWQERGRRILTNALGGNDE